VKAPSVIAKNLKLLFRSKESAFTIIFGPLLIILLVSAAYTGGDNDTRIRIGTYAPEYTGLADKVITSLNAQGHLVSVYNNKSACIAPIATGKLHTCIIFPPDFRFKENGTNEVVFAVDYSRINLVYEIIDQLSKEFQLQRTELAEGAAGDVLQRVTLAENEMHSQLAQGQTLNEQLGAVTKDLATGQEELGSVDVNVNFTDLRQIRGRVTGLGSIVTNLHVEAEDAIDHAIKTLEDVEDNVQNETQDLVYDTISYLKNNASDNLREISDKAPEAMNEVSDIIDDAANNMEVVQQKYEELVAASDEADKRIGSANDELARATGRLTELQGKLAHVDNSLQQMLGLKASSLAAPITTRIEAVNSEESNLTFTYPYVLMLVIMFLGLMLNSSLIVMDKTSTAAFRNFTTATKDEYHLLLSFVTTFLILLLQTLVILAVSYFFVKAPLFNNFGPSIIIITFAITLFSFLGMIIGYLSTTQEAAMITSLSIGSVLLFVSNLVLPLEAMNKLVGFLSVYNPYVVMSELLKQSILFDLRLIEIPGKMALVIAAIIGLFLLVIAIQRSFKTKFFQRRSKDLATAQFVAKQHVKPLKMGTHEVKDLFDLLEALDAMTRAEFHEAFKSGKYRIANWVRDELGEKRLARKLRSPIKERIILVLDTHIKRETRRLQKKR